MTDLLISAVTNYQPHEIAPWINSARRVYDGDIVVIDFGTPVETIKYLQKKGVQVFKADLNGRHIVVERFIAMYGFLQDNHDYNLILATDIKDVIFQRNPFGRIQKGKNIVLSSEQMVYKDEEWGDNNMRVSYPHMYDKMKDEDIYNAGIIMGNRVAITDLFLHIYHLSLIGGDPQPDQAALNILAKTHPFKKDILFMGIDDGFAVNLGTSLADNVKDKYKSKLLGDAPRIDSNGVVRNYYTEDFKIVHQWDRVSALKLKILEKFGSLE